MRPLTPLEAEIAGARGRIDVPVGHRFAQALADMAREGLLVVRDSVFLTEYVRTPRLRRALRVHQAWLASGGGR